MSEKLANAILFLLHIAGACVALWLLRTHIGLALGESDLSASCTVLGVGGGSGCEAIALSPFSTILFFPLAGIALGYYFAQIILLLWATLNSQTRFEPLYVSLNLATAALAVTVLMAAISLLIVHSFCLGCATLWLINALVWLITPFRIGISPAKALAANFETLSPRAMNLDRSRVRKAFLVASVFVIAVSGLAGGMISTEKAKYSAGGLESVKSRYDSAPQVFLPAEALEGDRTKGAPAASAKLVIVKFSDFQCPACKRAAQLFKPFYLRHKDEVRFVYRNYPLDGSCNPYAPQGSHYMACATAIAGLCAAQQGKFQEFYALAFDGQDRLTPAYIKETAEKIGVDFAKFQECQASQETKDELQRDIAWGESISLHSTPTFMINGRKIEGGFAPEQWEELLKVVSQGK